MRCFFLFIVLVLSTGSKAHAQAARPARRPAAPVTAVRQTPYAQLDEIARLLPETQATALDQLAAALAAHARSDEEKARLIFAWIAYHVAYDVAGVQGRGALHVTAEQALSSRLASCQGYADLFTSLATRMSLSATTVVGYANVDPTGSTLPVMGADRSHAWNIYRTASGAHLVDTCWGAGALSADAAAFLPQFDTYWFNPPPEQAIFMHWPLEASAQLLAAPVDAATFRRWPYVDATWFKAGINATSLRQALASATGKLVGKPLPRLYTTGQAVQLVQIPRHATLVAGQAATFVFAVGPGVEVGLEGSGWVVPAQAQGKYRRLTLTPTASAAPHIVTWLKADATKLFSLLDYQVVSAVRRSDQARSAARDSVTYLRH